jgi:PAS domain S-box-containing protein
MSSGCPARNVEPWRDNRPLWRELLDRGSLTGDFKLLCPDGQVRDVQAIASANVEAGRHLIVVRDISERRESRIELSRALDALRHQARRLEVILDAVPCGVIILEQPDGHVSYANDQARQLVGRSPVGVELFRQVELFGLSRPDGSPFLPGDLPGGQALAKGVDSRGIEVLVRRPDGGQSTIMTAAHPLRDELGNVTAAVVAFVDITDLKQAEHALRLSHDDMELRVLERTQKLAETIQSLQAEVRQRLAAEQHVRGQARMLDAFFNHTNTPLVVMDREFNFVRVNEAYAKACNRPITDFIGHNHFEYYPHAENEAIFREVVRTRQAYQVYAKPFLFPDHPQWGVTWWDWSLTPLLNDEGEVEFLVFTLENVTERVRGEQELRHRAEQLRALAGELAQTEQRERRRLAGVLHDHLQQLLVGAKFRTAVLGRTPEVADAATEIEQLLSEAIAASRSLTAELSPPILHEAALPAALEWLASSLAAKHNLQVELSAGDGELPLAEDVKTLLFEAVRELLFNVVKHAGVLRAKVTLSRHDGETARVIVSDDGKGFEPDKLQLAAHGPDGQFGLFSIRERLTWVGGRMTIESAPGRGSRFIMDAPLARQPQPVIKLGGDRRGGGTQVSPRKAAQAGRVRIMLADDHVVMREGLARLLGSEPDLEVVGEASDGLIAVDKARRLAPDIILMDLSMPNLNGVEATRIIRRDMPETRVIGLSMFEEGERAQAMLDAGASAYITKSGPANELLALIRSVAAVDRGGRKSASSAGVAAVRGPRRRRARN